MNILHCKRDHKKSENWLIAKITGYSVFSRIDGYFIADFTFIF